MGNGAEELREWIGVDETGYPIYADNTTSTYPVVRQHNATVAELRAALAARDVWAELADVRLAEKKTTETALTAAREALINARRAMIVSVMGISDGLTIYDIKRWIEQADAALSAPPPAGAPQGWQDWTKVSDQQPAPHARYLVRRDGVIYTATPCYGMHAPWWVPRSMQPGKFEDAPVVMADADEWLPTAPEKSNG